MTPTTSECEGPVTAAAQACVLLAGGLRPSPLVLASGSSILDLHLVADATVMDLWARALLQIVNPDQDSVPLRIISGAGTPAPTVAPAYGPIRTHLETEAAEYRGPAGVLADVCADDPADSLILVAEAARFVNAPTDDLIPTHIARSADVTVVCNRDGSPAGVYVVKRSALDLVPRKGFMDLKEQWLPKAVAAGKRVLVHRLQRGRSHPLRSREQFLQAAASAADRRPPQHDDRITPRTVNGPVRGDGAPGAADVAPDALILDSVVMPGARVGAGALVARAVVCPGATVPRGAEIVDCIIGPLGVKSDSDESWSRARKGG